MAYTAPKDWAAAEVVTAANMNAQVRDNLKHIAGTSGFTGTPSATRGIEPSSGYFMGGTGANRHVESGSGTTDGSGNLSVTFANAFASNPKVVACPGQGSDAGANITAVSTTGCTVNTTGATTAVYWMAEGAD